METESLFLLGTSVPETFLLVDLLMIKDAHFQPHLSSLTSTMTVSTSVPHLPQLLPFHLILLTLMHHPHPTSHLHLVTFRTPSKI